MERIKPPPALQSVGRLESNKLKNTWTPIKRAQLKGSETEALQRPNQSTELNHVGEKKKEFREAGIAGRRNRPRVLEPPVMLR